MKKKSKWIVVVAAGLLATQQAKPDIFGMDIGVLTAILGQVQQEVTTAGQILSGVQQTKNEVIQAANYIQHPTQWMNLLNQAVRFSGSSNGSDAAQLLRLGQMLQATKQAYNQFGYTQLSSADLARMSQLGIQVTNLQQQYDELNGRLQSQAAYLQKNQTGGDFGCVSCTLGAHQQ